LPWSVSPLLASRPIFRVSRLTSYGLFVSLQFLLMVRAGVLALLFYNPETGSSLLFFFQSTSFLSSPSLQPILQPRLQTLPFLLFLSCASHINDANRHATGKHGQAHMEARIGITNWLLDAKIATLTEKRDDSGKLVDAIIEVRSFFLPSYLCLFSLHLSLSLPGSVSSVRPNRALD
jgi:hypothetical protein